ncbi:MAG: nuclear transport factor 2 family protein [Acidobacteriota bacterium]
MPEARETALRFVDAINRGDLADLDRLVTSDHEFVDSDGTRTTGRQAVIEGWAAFFGMVCGYTIDATEIHRAGDVVVLVGVAKGAFEARNQAGRRIAWEVPAAWRAVVRGDEVARWQVFVNPEPILAALQRSKQE